MDKAERIFNKLAERKSRAEGAMEGALISTVSIAGAKATSPKLFPGSWKSNLAMALGTGLAAGALFPGKKGKSKDKKKGNDFTTLS
jgi:hypothetical protein